MAQSVRRNHARADTLTPSRWGGTTASVTSAACRSLRWPTTSRPPHSTKRENAARGGQSRLVVRRPLETKRGVGT